LARLPTFCSICLGNVSLHPPPPFNVVSRDEFVIARFQHCLGGREVPIPVISLLIVCKIACQRIFMLSDSGVPRTFVGDCRSHDKRENPNFRSRLKISDDILCLGFRYLYKRCYSRLRILQSCTQLF